MKSLHVVRPDAKGRICLGDLAKGISSFHFTYDDQTGKIILEPYAEMPKKESWLFENPVALARVRKGLKQASVGDLIDRGRFAPYLDEAD